MLHIPIRGVFLLTRAAALCVAAAAAPILVKQAKPLAKKIGDELEKFGKWMKEEAESEPTPAPKASTATTEKPNGANGKPAASKPAAAKSAAKKPAPRKRTTKAKPKPKAPGA